MQTQPITGGAAAASGGQRARDAQIGLASDFDSFLKLLTTQLTNQGPLEPLDANEFTAQLVQFTGVEQSIRTNGLLEQLLALDKVDRLARGAEFIGAVVEADSATVRVGAGGPAAASYRLPEAAAAVDLEIRNEAGEVVWQGTGSGAAGSQSVPWNGLDAKGQRVPDGLYRVEITAVDPAGRPVPVETSISGIVDAVEFGGDGGMMLSVDGVLVPSDAVTRLHRQELAS